MIEELEKTSTNIEYQTIYINMDDSGVLHRNEKYCVYGGVVFVGSNERDCFIRKYKGIINGIKCDYCNRDIATCHHTCPEIKHSNIWPEHKRRIYNLIKKNTTFAVIINNSKVRKNIMNNKNSRGRFRDYCQRRIIKNVIQGLIDSKKIDPYKPIKLIIRIDQQGTSTNTNRVFSNDIYNELTNGIYNMKYDLEYPAIIFSTLEIELKYVVSNRHACIQASDFVAGMVRQIIVSNLGRLEKKDKIKFLNNILYLP